MTHDELAVIMVDSTVYTKHHGGEGQSPGRNHNVHGQTPDPE